MKTAANGLYRAKNFNGAAAVLTSSLSSFSGDDAQDLRTTAKIYAQLGKAYNVGMAPGTKPIEAFQALRRALDYDRDVGSAHVAELQARLANVAPRAAGSFMAGKQFESAFQAVRAAEALGSKSPSNKSVRALLEQNARDLYREATAARASEPETAKRKLRQILGIVDPSNPVYVRAQKQLNGP